MARGSRIHSFDTAYWRGALRRLPVLLAGLATFTLVVQVSIAGSFRDTRPSLALRYAPIDARARTKLAAAIVSGAQTKEARNSARALATDAVKRDPLMPAALRVIAQSHKDGIGMADEKVTALMLEAQRLSRRDNPTQLWLANDNALRGNVNEVIDHFDIALLTSNAARPNIFPLLLATTADPRFRQALVQKLRERPDWTKAFLDHAVRNGSNLDFATDIAPQFLDSELPDDRVMIRTLMERLTAAGEFDRAWQVRQELSGERTSDVVPLRNGDFESVDEFAPFGWTLADDPELWAARERDTGDGYLLRIAAYNGRSGEVARQLIKLRPGAYQIRLDAGDIPANAYERPQLRVSCANDSEAELLELAPASAGAGPRSFAGRFTVPGGCSFQWLAITAAGEGSLRDPLPWIDNIRIAPAR